MEAANLTNDFILISPQKTGTHLATEALEQLLNKRKYFYNGSPNPPELKEALDYAKRNNSFVFMHAFPRKLLIALLRQHHYKVIFMWRDPRDQAISLLHVTLKGKLSFISKANRPHFMSLSFEEQLHEVITGERYGVSATEKMMLNRIDWFKQDPHFVYVCKFENLVGEEGGGSKEKQLTEMQNIAKHLHLRLNTFEIEKRSRHIFGKGANFRSGQIGSWKKDFTPYLKNSFKQKFNKMLIQTGYESDENW